MIRGMRIFAFVFVIAAFGLPFLWMFTTSFKSQADFTTNPLMPFFTPSLENYSRVFSEVPFLRYLINSFLVTAGSVILTIMLAAPAAYALARRRFFGKSIVGVALVIGLTIPIHITLLPLMKTTQLLGIYDTLFALGAIYTAFGLALTILILKNSFEALPKELFEAAKLDGCSEWQTFFFIALPLSRPAIAVVAIYNFVMNYNEFAFALTMINTRSKYTLPLGVEDLAHDFGADIPATAAAISIAVIPALIVFLFAQKHLISGLTAGAVKG